MGPTESRSTTPADRLRVSPTLAHARVDDLWMVLDMADTSYFVFDEVASAIWEALLETGDADAAVERVSASWGEERERVRRDVDRFVARCRERRWLVDDGAPAAPPDPRPPPRPPTARPSVARACTTLAATAWSLRRRGLRETYERCARLPQPGGSGDLESAASAFRGAENVVLSRRAPDDCLLRSLALFRFLRTCGIPAEHVIGVRRSPFWAHAWVESGGRLVLEVPAAVRGLTPLARLPVGTP
ncbi:MAG TPA: lasso peptide biosynthesis B2 protein [Thermoleophilaceae bacterium]